MFKYALSLVLRRKLRTFLTSLGITIAVLLISFIIFGMQDLKSLLVNQFDNVLKPNQAIITKGGEMSMFTGAGNTTYDQKSEKPVVMSKEVISKIEQKDYVESVDRLNYLMGLQITLVEKKVPFPQPMMSGWDVKSDNPYFSDFTGDSISPENGKIWVSKSLAKFYKTTESDLIGMKVIIEPSPESMMANKSKSIIGKKFEYVISGVYDPGQDKNDAILNIDESLKLLSSLGGFSNVDEYVQQIGYDALYVTVKSESMDSFKEFVKEDFKYEIYTADDIISILGTITNGLTIALVMFGMVAALVASIGIINTMIMSIYEQTKEIGIVKAIGASNMQVLSIFLVQSGFIGLLGGGLGLGFVFLIMKATDGLIVDQLKNAGFTTTSFFNFDLRIALIITVISILVGVIAGIYPAIRAAKLDPIKALRYE